MCGLPALRQGRLICHRTQWRQSHRTTSQSILVRAHCRFQRRKSGPREGAAPAWCKVAAQLTLGSSDAESDASRGMQLRHALRRCCINEVDRAGIHDDPCHWRIGTLDRATQAGAEIIDVEEHEVAVEAIQNQPGYGLRLLVVGDAVEALQ